ncbi:unnamed protein product [Brassica oleracea var. botrytis]|uniref:(rape) hypothetical protein n=1 Tax=Brassica napus TaxID=3708 RepID=A0A816MN55_BRANA|nr:unnamed protein product [Brassica napus]
MSRRRSRREKEKANSECSDGSRNGGNERTGANSILKGVCFLGRYNRSRERTMILLKERWKNLFQNRCR